jgi:hypothetical protein
VGRTLISATITTSPQFAVLGRRQVNENLMSYTTIHADYDVFPDGRRVLGLQATEADIRMVMVHNWAAELRPRLTGRQE